MHTPYDNADSGGCRPIAGALRASPTVNPGDEDEDDEEEGGGSGGGNIDPEEDEGYDEEEDDDDEDPLWATARAAAHHSSRPLAVAAAGFASRGRGVILRGQSSEGCVLPPA